MNPPSSLLVDSRSSVVVKEELSVDSTRKRSTFLAEVNGSKLLVCVEPRILHKEHVEHLLQHLDSSSLIYSNDRWASFHGETAKMDVTFPATEREIILASSACSKRLVLESPQLYRRRIRPFINASPDRQPPAWIKNIINGSSEQDRIIFADENFIILPDSKWPGVDVSSVYLLVLFKDSSLKTIRDLSSSKHLGLLKELKTRLQATLAEKFGLDYPQVRPYFHYHPSFYLLHLHVPHISLEYTGAVVGRAHLLDDVIDNMEHFGVDFYSGKKSLVYSIDTAADPLFYSLFEEDLQV